MPYRTKYGKHYHMTQGCHGADIPCGTEGLSPCSDCCGNGQGGPAAGGSAVGAGGSAIVVDSEIIGVSDVTLDGVSGTLYKLDKLLDPEDRRAISELDGVRTFVIAAQYAPELRRTGVFVEDGYSYDITRAGELSDIGASAMADPVAAPNVSLSDGDGADAPAEPTREPAAKPADDELPVSRQEMDELLSRFGDEYDFIYKTEEQGRPVAGYDEALSFGEDLIRARKDLVGAFAKERGDLLTSDREVAAFGFVVSEILGGPELVIPSVDAVDPADAYALVTAAFQTAREGSPARLEEKARDERMREFVKTEGMKGEIGNRLMTEMEGDRDVSMSAGYISRSMRDLLDCCEIEETGKEGTDEYTKALVTQYVVFAACYEDRMGGSHADYCAEHAVSALSGYRIRLRNDADADAVLGRIRAGIDGSALYKFREYGHLTDARVPINRKSNLAAERRMQAGNAEDLERMGDDERRAMWRTEAKEWAETMAGTRQIDGEGRDPSLALRSYGSFDTAKADLGREMSRAIVGGGKRMGRRYGAAFTAEMQDERARAYSAAMSQALRTLSSRSNEGRQRARNEADARATLERTRDYGMSTPLAALHPEERRQLATLFANSYTDGYPDVPASGMWQVQDRLSDVLESGTIGDLSQVTGTDPMEIVDDVCVEAILSTRARGIANPRDDRR